MLRPSPEISKGPVSRVCDIIIEPSYFVNLLYLIKTKDATLSPE